ncbi:MAG: hypothetical protein FWB93_05790 [Oscillospiraceae bacterium]|nr:hypothetical protein [Oscillospiraceae bacterium]
MVLDLKQTTIAYFCPKCTHSVQSMVGVFSLSGDMIRLRCSCGEAGEVVLTVSYTSDRKVRLSVPCLFCPTPHNFVISSEVFFGQELFVLSCPYTGLDIAFTGESNHVRAACDIAVSSIVALMDEVGLSNLPSVHKDDADSFEDDGQISEIIRFMLAELREDGKIQCNCDENGAFAVDFKIGSSGVQVFCRGCDAQTLLPLYGVSDATAFISTDELKLV